MSFDPDKYLKKKQGFDPDAYLQKKSIKEAPEEKVAQVPVSSDLRDFGMATGQGITIGFGDELLAAAKAAGEVATGEPELSDFVKLYRQYQKQNEAEYEKMRERSPVLSTAGEIAGGILPAIVSGGTSSTASLGRLALTSAGMGALSSLGGSKGTTEEAISDIQSGKVPELVTDVGFGAGVGALAPVAFKAQGIAGKYLKEKIQDTPFLTQLFESFKQGTKGRGFLGRKAGTILDDEATKKASELENTIERGRDFISSQYKKVLKPDVVISPEESINFKTADNILKTFGKRAGLYDESGKVQASTEFGRAVLSLEKLQKGKINAQELKDLQKFLRSSAFGPNMDKLASDQLDATQRFANEILKNKVEGYSAINDKYKNLENAIETIISGVPTESRTVGKNIATEGTPLFKATKDIVEKASLPFDVGKKEFSKLNLLKKELKNLEQKNPDVLRNMGISNVDDFVDDILKQTDIQSIGTAIRKGGSLRQGVLPTGETVGGLYAVSNIAGKGAGWGAAPLKALKLPELSKAVYNFTDDKLYRLADKLNSSGQSHLGNALNDALKNKSLTTKNAVLFSLLQNPNNRRLIIEEEENE